MACVFVHLSEFPSITSIFWYVGHTRRRLPFHAGREMWRDLVKMSGAGFLVFLRFFLSDFFIFAYLTFFREGEVSNDCDTVWLYNNPSCLGMHDVGECLLSGLVQRNKRDDTFEEGVASTWMWRRWRTVFPISFFLSRGINRNMEWGGRRRRRRKPFLGVLGNCKSNMKDDDVPGVGAWNSRQVLILRVGRFLSSVRLPPNFSFKIATPKEKERKEKKQSCVVDNC